MKAYHSDPGIKAAVLAQIRAHREADQLVKRTYWENGEGCAIGCAIHSKNHSEYETRFGIPVAVAYFEDTFFENLPNELAMELPERFMGAITPGSDLSLVQWKLLHWLLTDENVNPGIRHPLVSEAVVEVAKLMAVLAEGGTVSKSAARSSAGSARSAGSAAWSAMSAACSAGSAAWSAESAMNARSAESVRNAAGSAAGSAGSARNAAWVLMSDKLVQLCEEAV